MADEPLIPAPEGEPPPPTFRAGTALLALGFIGLVQALVGFTALVIFMAFKPKVEDPLADPEGLAAFLFGLQVGFAGAAVAAGRKWAGPLVKDRTASGLGLFLPQPWTVGVATLFGAGLAAAFLGIEHHFHKGPMAEGSPGLGGLLGLTMAVSAVFLAPPSEEYVFRGLLLKGLSASWGTAAASAVVTLLFVALHWLQILAHPRAAVFIFLFAIAALVARLRTGSLVPSMAMHAAYNLVVVGAASL